MFGNDDSFRQRTLTSRLLRGGWYRLLEDTRMQISTKGGSTTRIVLANAYLDQHFVYTDCFEFSATETNVELWQAFRQLIREDQTTALRILPMPSGIYDLLSKANDADIGRISQKFFCCFKLKDNCMSLLNDAMSGNAPASHQIPAAFKNFLNLYWLSVWNVASMQPSRAAAMFDIPFDLAQTISTFSTLRMLQVIEGLCESVYELRFNPYLIEGILKYPDDAMIFSLMQVQHAVQKPEDVKYSLSWHEPEIEVDPKAVVRDYLNKMPTNEICEKYKINRYRLVNILKDEKKAAKSMAKENEMLNRLIQNYYRDVAEMLTIWGLAQQDVRAISGLTPAQFRTLREKLVNQDLLPPDYDVTKFSGALHRKLCLGDQIVASLFLSIYSRLGSSNIYKTVNIPAMIIAQIVIKSIIETPYFAPLQPTPFNPRDAWVWARDLQTSKVKFIHCPKCGCLYISFFDEEDDYDGALPCDDEYDPNVDYSHPCPYCRYIASRCTFGKPGQTRSAITQRKANYETFFAHLAKEISPLTD